MPDQLLKDRPEFHFISGLPRSGTTLLAAVLAQNPAFHASFQSPVGTIIGATQNSMGPENENYLQINDLQRSMVMRGIFRGFYEKQLATYIFDQNRRWTTNIDLLATVFPDCLVIAMVRNPLAIVESFERIYRANPLRASRMFGNKGNQHLYQRVSTLMENNGVVGFSLNSFRTAYFGAQRDRMLVIPYENFVRAPTRALGLIHRRLGAEPFTYDFNKISDLPGTTEFDAYLGTPGLHSLKPVIRHEDRKSVLPPDLERTVPKPFWGDGDLAP